MDRYGADERYATVVEELLVSRNGATATGGRENICATGRMEGP